MKAFLLGLFSLYFLSTAYAAPNIDYCATPQAWAAQLTLATLRHQGYAPQPLPKVELLSQHKLSGTSALATSKVFGELYSQTLLITVISARADRPNKRFIVNTIVSDQECSMADPVIIDTSLIGEDQP